MKSLDKTFNVLEYIFNKDGVPATPAEVASVIGINCATCSRILGVLLRKGYVEKVSRRIGYIPGPSVFALSARQSPYARIAKASREAIEELAMKTGAIVNISIMRGGYRYILFLHTSDGTKKIPIRTRYLDDNYTTATGRLLLSIAPQEDIDFVVDRLGFPQDRWNGIKDMRGLAAEFTKVSKRKIITYPMYNVWIVGGLVEAATFPPAAIGFGVETEEKAEEAVAHLKKCVADIEAKLSSNTEKNTFLY